MGALSVPNAAAIALLLLSVFVLVGLLIVPVIVKFAGGAVLPIVGILLAAVIAIALLISKRKGEDVIEVQKRINSSDVA